MAPSRADFETVKQTIQHKWGQHAVQTLRSYAKHRTTCVISTGYPELDGLLGIGGIPCGYSTLLFGTPTSGMTTLAYRLIAQAQQKDAVIAYVDLANTFDAEYASDRCGVDTEHLLHISAEEAITSLAIVRDLVGLAYRGLIIVDSGIIMAQHKSWMSDLSELLERVRIPLRQSAWTLLVLLPVHFISTCTLLGAIQLCLERKAWTEKRGAINGYQTIVTVRKNTLAPSGGSTTLFFTHEAYLP
jgi:recA bacterial DNA recombination protein